MKIALYGRNIDKDFFPTLKSLVSSLKEKGVELVIEEIFYDFLVTNFEYKLNGIDFFSKEKKLSENLDMLLSIGGDGTFLDTLEYIVGSQIPILGINTGRLGFLANVGREEIDAVVEDLVAENYKVEQRDLLQLEINNQIFPTFDYALNEVGVLKSETSSLLTLEVSIDDEFLTKYWADGLIVATPTGSTAYSLSGGGPIVAPNCEVLILTPICPHNLSVRPLVVPRASIVKIKVESRTKDYVLSMDSRTQRIGDSNELCIKSHTHKVNVVALSKYSYYNTLRNKLFWGQDKRSVIK